MIPIVYALKGTPEPYQHGAKRPQKTASGWDFGGVVIPGVIGCQDFRHE